MARLALTTFGLLAFPGTAAAQPFDAYYSGSSLPIGPDADSDGTPSAVSASRGTSRRFGSFTSQSVAELGPWDGETYCRTGPDWEARLAWVSYSGVWTFASLD